MTRRLVHVKSVDCTQQAFEFVKAHGCTVEAIVSANQSARQKDFEFSIFVMHVICKQVHRRRLVKHFAFVLNT